MVNFIKTIWLTTIGIILMVPTISYAQQEPTNKALYKWLDAKGTWHYSKVPPSQQNKDTLPKKLEIAKDTKIIIFSTPNIPPIEDNTQLSAEQLQRQQKISCQTAQTNMMNTAHGLHKITDKNFQEKKITLDEYNREKQLISKLEEIGSDTNFNNYCMDNFSKQPQLKAITNCILSQDSKDDPAICLKELPQT